MKTKNHTLYLIVICFLMTMSLTAQIPNNGFENWVLDGSGNLNPEGWETTNNFPDVSVEQYTPAYSGNYSMRVKSFDPGGFPVAGMASIDFPCILRPARITACIKTSVMPGDAVYIIFSLWKGDSIVASPGNCTFVIDSTINQFDCITFPITYLSPLDPDSANIMVIAGSSGNTQIGTEIIVDELTFSFATGINEAPVPQVAVLGQNFPNPSSTSTFFPLTLNEGSDITLYLYDIQGKKVKTTACGFLASGEHMIRISVVDLPGGMYHYSIKGDDFIIPGKFIVNK